MDQVVKVLQFQVRTEAAYRKAPTNFASILNMALYHHTVSLDVDTARRLYQEAAAKSTKHPVVCFSYGMFKLIHGVYPREKIWAEAQVRERHVRVVPLQRLRTLVGDAWAGLAVDNAAVRASPTSG